MSRDRTDVERERDRRESFIWMILAGLGTLIPVGFSFIGRTHLRSATSISSWIEFIVVSSGLIAAIPFAVKVNHELDLPGGPLIIATLRREPQPYRWREVLLAGVLWAVIALVVLVIGVSVVVGLLLCFLPSYVPHIPRSIQHAPIVKPSEIWLVSSVVISAVSAGVQEEILFRFVLMGVSLRVLMALSGNVDQPASRSQLWLANLVQAYFFGLWHLLYGFHTAQGFSGAVRVAIRSFVKPQTFDGIFLGWLYLRSGLETSMVSHIFVDLLSGGIHAGSVLRSQLTRSLITSSRFVSFNISCRPSG
jgi:membrane protease YdiL (CAAX protease family)